MATLKIILYSIQGSQCILYTDTDGVMTSEIEHVYFRECESLSLRPGGARIKVSEKTRDALLTLEQKYDQVTHFHIRKLRSFISKLKDGDYFYYFNKEKAPVMERRIAVDCLSFERAGVPFCKVLHNITFEHYSVPSLMFQFLSYGHDGLKECIGEEDIQKRKCRFCGKSVPEVTFEKDAHAIQDALGNKLLFCLEECDTCNHDLAVVENQFRIMMDFRRSIFRIPRKETTKAVKVVGKDFIILADKNGDPNLYLMKETLEGIDITKPFMRHLELKEPIVNEQMYKALCKMVIDMLPSCELSHFENTIRWIKSKDFASDTLPSIWLGNLPTEEPVYKQPAIDIFINNKELKRQAPYCTAIIWIYDIAYLFVVPFVDIDAGQYKYDEQLTSHLKWIQGWTGIKQWQQQDTNNYHLSTSWINWSVDPTLPNVHILSKYDSVFDECKVMKAKRPDIQMPDVEIKDLSLVRIDNIEFESYYDNPIYDKDLMDITQHISGPSFIINSEREQVKVALEIEAKDTTDKILFFKFSFAVDIRVNRFNEYVKLADEGMETSFAFHYQLRDALFVYALAMAEVEMKKLRKGTQFEKCTLDKLLQSCERMLDGSVYLVPVDNNRYRIVKDSWIHGVGYE